MKLLCGVLVIVCLLQTYFVFEARKERRVIYDSLIAMRNNYINRDIVNIRITIKAADEIATNPVNGLDIINKLICSGNPFPDDHLHLASVNKETVERMLLLKEDVSAHCKKVDVTTAPSA